MVFSSIIFLFYFLPALLLAYYIVPPKAKNPVLFAGGLIFCAWGGLKCVLLLLFLAAINFAGGIAMGKIRQKKPILIANIIINLGALVYFRYFGFLTSLIGMNPAAEIIMPVGIAIYTLRALSYTIDVYRGTTAIQRNFVSFGLYLALFPLLVAGPVVRYNDVARQLPSRRATGTRFLNGFSRFSAGLCKKVIIADSVGRVWSMISTYDFTGLSAASAWLGIICFTLGIYFELSGYSDMAIGLGKMFGFDFAENFRYPYNSKSMTEFWSRWFVSISAWFKEYVYLPLGANKKGVLRTCINIIIVWTLIGLWHGAGLNFVLWGFYCGLIIVIEKTLLKNGLKKIGPAANIYTMLLVIIGWALFATADIKDFANYIGAMFNFGYGGFGEQDFLYNFTSYVRVIVIAIIIASGLPEKLLDKHLPKKYTYIKYICALIGLGVCTAYIVNGTPAPFVVF